MWVGARDLGEELCGVRLLHEQEGGTARERSVVAVTYCKFLGYGFLLAEIDRAKQLRKRTKVRPYLQEY